MVERRVISDQDGLALEHTETLYAADRYEFDAILYRGDTEEAR
jgi:DNA-binding GntR family transcriptional regulator